MTAAPRPPDEAERLRSLQRLSVLDTAPDLVLDGSVRCAAAVSGFPVSLVTLLDETRQWFKARTGLDLTETPRDVAFCAPAMLGDGLIEVPDATLDPRFADNALVHGAAPVRYDAGVPIGDQGHSFGTLCVIDHRRRGLTDEQKSLLVDLARMASAWFAARREHQELEEQRAHRRPAAAPRCRPVCRCGGGHRARCLEAARARLRVLLVDDHALFRAGLRGLLERESGAQITGECATADEALAALGQPLPDIALLDISLRGGDGIELARRIGVEHGGRVRCIVVSMHPSAACVRRAIEAGVCGYVTKDDGPEELISAVQVAMAGQRYVSPGASAGLIDSIGRAAAPALHDTLTTRQLQVLRQAARGLSTPADRARTGLSTKTVDSHRYQISQRLGLHDVAGRVRHALFHGLADAAV